MAEVFQSTVPTLNKHCVVLNIAQDLRHQSLPPHACGAMGVIEINKQTPINAWSLLVIALPSAHSCTAFSFKERVTNKRAVI